MPMWNMLKKGDDRASSNQEEIIFNCPACDEQLICTIPTRRAVVIQCGECHAKCSVKQARKARKAWEQLKKQEQAQESPPLEVTELIPQLGSKENADIVRALSLKPGGKAALERARQAKESKRASQISHRGSLPENSFAPAPADAPPGPVRRASSRLTSREAAAPYAQDHSSSRSHAAEQEGSGELAIK